MFKDDRRRCLQSDKWISKESPHCYGYLQWHQVSEKHIPLFNHKEIFSDSVCSPLCCWLRWHFSMKVSYTKRARCSPFKMVTTAICLGDANNDSSAFDLQIPYAFYLVSSKLKSSTLFFFLPVSTRMGIKLVFWSTKKARYLRKHVCCQAIEEPTAGDFKGYCLVGGTVCWDKIFFQASSWGSSNPNFIPTNA